jgi:hypothetical protein
MWNCIGCSFDYMSNLNKCSLLTRVISVCVPLVTTVLEGIYLVTHITGGVCDVHGNGGFIAMFVVS